MGDIQYVVIDGGSGTAGETGVDSASCTSGEVNTGRIGSSKSANVGRLPPYSEVQVSE